MTGKTKRTDTVRAARSQVVEAARRVVVIPIDGASKELKDACIALAYQVQVLDDRLAASKTQREATAALAEA